MTTEYTRIVIPTDGGIAFGTATAANQLIEIGLLTQISGQLPLSLGQHPMSGSLSVVIASDQVVPVSSITKSNINRYNEVTNVAMSILTTILTYTVPISPANFYLNLVEVAGTNIAEYTVVLDGDIIAKKYTYFGGNLDTDFPFNGLTLSTGQVLEVKVTHNRPSLGNFDARINGNSL